MSMGMREVNRNSKAAGRSIWAFALKNPNNLGFRRRAIVNRGADQLCSYCTADQRLCFRICGGSYIIVCDNL